VGGGVMVSVAVISLVGDRVLLGVPEDEADEDAVEVGDGVGGGVRVSVTVTEADGDREWDGLWDAVNDNVSDLDLEEVVVVDALSVFVSVLELLHDLVKVTDSVCVSEVVSVSVPDSVAE
jgi:hypothetical protein